jgi:hypothetical protein
MRRAREYVSFARRSVNTVLSGYCAAIHHAIMLSRAPCTGRKKSHLHKVNSYINCKIKRSNSDPLAKHDGCVLIREIGETKDAFRRSISSLQEVTIWPLNVIIQEDVSQQTLELIDREKSARAVDQVSTSSQRASVKVEWGLQE